MYPPYRYEAKELHDAMKVLHFAINYSGHLGPICPNELAAYSDSHPTWELTSHSEGLDQYLVGWGWTRKSAGESETHLRSLSTAPWPPFTSYHSCYFHRLGGTGDTDATILSTKRVLP